MVLELGFCGDEGGRGGLLGFGVSIRFVRRLGPGCGLDGPGA